MFSTTKGVTAIAANLLVQRGELDLDAKVADYWPEFAQAGKADIPVRWLLSHRAGLPWVDGEMTLEQALDWDYVIDALERQAPVWEPGTQHGYHATTFGWLVGEVVRRVSGHDASAPSCSSELAEPARPRPVDRPARRAERPRGAARGHRVPRRPRRRARWSTSSSGPETMLGRALFAPGNAWGEAKFGSFNLPAVWAAEIPAANCITDARSLAKLYAVVRQRGARHRRPARCSCFTDETADPRGRAPDLGRRPGADGHGPAVRPGLQPARTR